MAWLGTWANRVSVLLDHTKVSAALTNFPVLIRLGSSVGANSSDLTPVFDELTADANRYKIAVTTSDGTTQCKVEIARWDDTNEVAFLWVKVPSVSNSADTILYLYYDILQADNTAYVGDVGSVPGIDVWSNDYVCVLHMTESGNGTANEFKDSSGNSNHGAGVSGTKVPTRTANSLWGYHQNFDGTDDRIKIDDTATGTNSGDLSQLTTGYLSTSFWINYDTLTLSTYGGYRQIITKSGDSNATLEYHFRMYPDTTAYPGRTCFYVYKPNQSLGAGASILRSETIRASEWHYIASVCDNDSYATGYHNMFIFHPQSGTTEWKDWMGMEYNNSDDGYDVYPPGSKLAPLWIGGGWDGCPSAWNLDGSIAEYHVRNVKSTTAWVNATYYTQADNLISYGALESGDTVSIEVAAQDDDILVWWTGAAWTSNQTGTILRVGYYDATDQRCGAGMRYLNVTIPKDATITTAYLKLIPTSTWSQTTVNAVIVGEDVDDAAIFSTIADYKTRRGLTDAPGVSGGSITTASISWDNIGGWTAGSEVQTPDIKTIIQEIVNRASWASGNDMVIFVDDHAASSETDANYHSRTWASYDNVTYTAPTLYVEYVPPASGWAHKCSGLASPAKVCSVTNATIAKINTVVV